MTTLWFETALLPTGWASGVRVVLAGDLVAAVDSGLTPGQGDDTHAIGLPGLASLHSHAFQRAMSGLAERRGPGADSFWSWREAMYGFALRMDPDQVEAVAAQLYVEMLEAGFVRVGEFHYLHHGPDGRPYANRAEMAVRIAAAADASGIGLTLLPVFYAHAGFGGTAPGEGQRRFIETRDGYATLLEASAAAIGPLAGANLGLAPHSLRAVTPEELSWLVELASGRPFHIHIAEQTAEIEQCLAWSGRRPVAWLLDHAAVGPSWCLVHATHMLPDETQALARTGAVAGLCPITEANLGDGTFDAPNYQAAGGAWGVGSDSNVQLGAAEELRQLEYSQRIAHRARNVMAQPGGSTGRALFDAALAGGQQALGQSAQGIVVGQRADIVALRGDHPALVAHRGDDILDAWIFAAGRDLVDTVWAGGRKRVSGGRHLEREAIEMRFSSAMRALCG